MNDSLELNNVTSMVPFVVSASVTVTVRLAISAVACVEEKRRALVSRLKILRFGMVDSIQLSD